MMRIPPYNLLLGHLKTTLTRTPPALKWRPPHDPSRRGAIGEVGPDLLDRRREPSATRSPPSEPAPPPPQEVELVDRAHGLITLCIHGEAQELRLRVSGDRLVSAAAYWRQMLRCGMREARTLEIHEHLPVPPSVWRDLVDHLHEHRDVVPTARDAVYLHTLIDYLIPLPTRHGKALTELAQACVRLVHGASLDEAVTLYNAASEMRNATFLGALVTRLVAARRDRAIGALTRTAVGTLLATERFRRNPGAGLQLLAAWAPVHCPRGVPLPDFIDAAGWLNAIDMGALEADGWRRHAWRAGLVRAAPETVPTAAAARVASARWATRLTEVGSIRAHDGGVSAVTLSGGIVLTAGKDGTARMWRLDDLACEATLPGHTWGARAVGRTGGIVLTASAFGEIKVWREPFVKPCGSDHAGSGVYALAVSDDLVVCGGGGPHIRLWDPVLHRSIANLSASVGQEINALLLTDDRIIAGGSSGSVQIWDRRTHASVHETQAHSGAVLGMALHGDVFVTASADGTVQVWDVRTAASVAVLRGHGRPVTCVAIHHGVIASGDSSGCIMLWSRDTWARLQTLAHPGAAASGLGLTDGCLVAADHDGQLRKYICGAP
jgi:WD40 repeat protein